MSSKEFDVNGTYYKIVLTEQVISHVNNLKELYNAAYEDPESFEDVSSEISNTINEIASTVEPEAEDSDLDGLGLQITCTGGPFVHVIQQMYIKVTYVEPSGYGNAVNGIAATDISEINGIATASISKVNGV